MYSPIEEIKSRLDIVDVVGSYIRLQKAGINLKATCPFHSEKTASFFVSPTRQMWHCFGCARGGDIFKFVMEIEGHEFPEALRLLASRAGVVLKREDPLVRSERNRLYDICEAAAEIFEKSLAMTPAARAYLRTRGLTEETIKEFRVGFAPKSWDFLLQALTAQKFTREEIEKAGLAIRSEDKSSWYDRFRGRIMFPITDANARVIGFGGRIFEQESRSPSSRTLRVHYGAGKNQEVRTDEAKYINTPQTLIYDKSRVLYGFDRARQEIRQKSAVVVVEGYMDCVMSHQAGVKNTIAVSGTALTPQQLQTVRRICDTMVSSFDTDAAGESATRRSLALASEFRFERRIVPILSGKPGSRISTIASGDNEQMSRDSLPGKDPADIIAMNPQVWVKAVEDAEPVVEFYFKKSFRDHNAQTVQGQKAIAATLLPLFAEIDNEIERAYWIRELAGRFGTTEQAIWLELEKQKKRGAAAPAVRFAREETSVSPVYSRRELLEERLLSLLTLVSDDVRAEAFQEHQISFRHALHEELFSILTASADNPGLTAELQKHMEMLRFKGEVAREMLQDVREEFFLCKRELEKECVKEKLVSLGKEIERLERDGNHTVVRTLLGDFRTLSERLKVISS